MKLPFPRAATAIAALLLTANAAAQQHDAKADGKAFAESLRGEAQQAASNEPDTSTLPNYDRNAVQGLETLADNPDRIEGSAAAAASGHQGYRTIRDSMVNRARFDPADIEQVIARSQAINETPLDFTSGMAITGSLGSCVPLPPGSAAAGTYTATCNSGTRIEQSAEQCSVPLIASVSTRPQYHYLCSRFPNLGGVDEPACSGFDGAGCEVTGERETCLQWSSAGGRPWCSEPGEPILELTCSAEVPGQTPYLITAATSVTTTPDESQCRGFADNTNCTLEGETCSDAEPQKRSVSNAPDPRSFVRLALRMSMSSCTILETSGKAPKDAARQCPHSQLQIAEGRVGRLRCPHRAHRQQRRRQV